MFAFVALCLLLTDFTESTNTLPPQPPTARPTLPPLPSQATRPTLPTRPLPSPPPSPGTSYSYAAVQRCLLHVETGSKDSKHLIYQLKFIRYNYMSTDNGQLTKQHNRSFSKYALCVNHCFHATLYFSFQVYRSRCRVFWRLDKLSRQVSNIMVKGIEY